MTLDSFDSTNPDDYIAGFPFHPHRGIETITYLASGRMDHRDSLGNEGTIRDGQAQWMCAGSGIMREEMPQPMPRMLGIQLWLNLPAAEKMSKPAYHGIVQDLLRVLKDLLETIFLQSSTTFSFLRARLSTSL